MSVYINEGAFWESEKIKKIYSKENLLLSMCKVEAAIASAEAEMGLVSQRDADKINAMVSADYIDLKVYDEQMSYTGGHPVVSFLTMWKKFFGDDPAKNVIHYASSTPDIKDNIKLLMLRDAYGVIKDDLYQVRGILRDLAAKYRDTPMVGRTHNQHAVPITFGCKVANWLMEIQRQILRLEESAKHMFVVNLFGAAGGISTLGKRGMEFNRLVGKYLDMGWTPVSMQVSRDTTVDFMGDLVSTVNTMGKIAMELFELSRTEIAEIAEPWTYGNVGSSTMPQKRNPWGLETMIAISRSCTCHMANLYSTMSQIHERDFMSYYQEDYSISNICNMCECILHYGIKILGGLEVFPDRMLKNLDMTNGSVMLEHMMMVLTTKNVNRYEAHHKLYDYAIKAYQENIPVKNLIMQDKEMMAVMSLEELDEAFEYMSYVGICPEQVDAALDICK
jgi:adenylosuccinate lyase